MTASPTGPIVNLVCGLALALISISAWSEAPEQNYAWIWTLAPEHDEPVWRVPLTDRLMADLHSSRGDDLLLVDARGQVIPFTHLPDAAMIEPLEHTQKLVIESARVEQDREYPDALELVIDHDGTRMRIRSPRTDPRIPAHGTLVFQALIGAPASSPEWPRHRLELDLTSPDRLSLDCRLSDADEEASAQQRIEFREIGDSRPRRFSAGTSIESMPAGWHLTCYGSRAPAGLEMTSARLVSNGQIDHRQRHNFSSEAYELPDKPGHFGFELDGVYRVHALSLRSDEPNLVSRIEVLSRVDEDQSWRRRGVMTLSTLESGIARLEFADQPVHRDRFWQLRAEPALERLPAINVESWQDELTFLARGQSPWRLYAGSRLRHDRAEPAAWLDETIQRLGPVWTWPSAKPDQRSEAGGPSVLETPPPPMPWQRYLLWAVLVLAAGLVIYLAVHLLGNR
jgi:hypothetical protein